MSSVVLETESLQEGRYKLTKKEFLELLLESIEKFRLSSETPVGKRLMVPTNCLSSYILFGKLKINNYLERNDKKIGVVKGRIHRWFTKINCEKSGMSWIVTPEVISRLKEVVPNISLIKEPGRGNDNKTIKEQLENIESFVEKITGYRCKFCKKEIYDTKDKTIQHLIDYHKLEGWAK